MNKRRGVVLALVFFSVTLIFLLSYVFASTTLTLSSGGTVTYSGCVGNYNASSVGNCYYQNGSTSKYGYTPGECENRNKSTCESLASDYGCAWNPGDNYSASCSDFNSNVTQCIDTVGCSASTSPACSSGTSLVENGTTSVCTGTYLSDYSCMGNSTTVDSWCNNDPSCIQQQDSDCSQLTSNTGPKACTTTFIDNNGNSLCEWTSGVQTSCSSISTSSCSSYSGCSLSSVQAYSCENLCPSGEHWGALPNSGHCSGTHDTFSCTLDGVNASNYCTYTSQNTADPQGNYLNCMADANQTCMGYGDVVSCGSYNNGSGNRLCDWRVNQTLSCSGLSSSTCSYYYNAGCSWGSNFGCIQNLCTETDFSSSLGSGNNPLQNGTTSSWSGTYSDYCVVQGGQATNNLTEFYCTSYNTTLSQVYNCSLTGDICKNGACVAPASPSTTPQLSFTQESTFVTIYPTNFNSSQLPTHVNLTATNYNGGGNMTLYMENYTKISGSFIKGTPIQIGIFQGSVSGSNTRSSTSWAITNYSFNSKYFYGTSNLFFFSVDKGKYNSSDLNVTYNAPTVRSLSATCVDTDKDGNTSSTQNTTLKGTVSVNGTQQVYTDYCFNASNPSVNLTTGVMLREYYCTPGNSSNYTDINCSATSSGTTQGLCSNGACTVTPDYCGDYKIENPDAQGIHEQCDLGTAENAKGISCNSSCMVPITAVKSASWQNASSPYNEIKFLNESGKSAGQFSVKMFLGNGSYQNSFAIYDAYGNTLIENYTSGSYSSSNHGTYKIWTPSGTDFASATNKSNNYTFYFVSQGIKSSNLTIYYSPDERCLGVQTCSDLPKSLCTSNNVCGVKPSSSIGTCSWQASSNICGSSKTVSTPNSGDITCNSVSTSKNSTCQGGLLKTSWTVSVNWGSDNYTSKANALTACPSGSGASPGQDKYNNSIWHCVPNGFTCQPGSKVIACPAEVELSFFDWKNVAAAVILIFILYVLFYNNKSKKKKVSSKNSSKNKSSKKKK